MIITVIAFVLGSLIGVTLGFWAGYKSGKMSDVVINIIIIIFVSVPSFILAAFLIVLGPKIGLPANFLDWSIYGFGKAFLSMILPILILVVLSLATITYYIRNEIKAILLSDYITNARSKGLGEWKIFKKYVFRNASIPLITVIFPSFVYLLTGSMVVETFFGIPGSSLVIINAIKTGETNIVMFNVLFMGFLSMTIRLVLDIIYVFIDPRIKYSSATTARNYGVISSIKRRKLRREQANG